MEEEEDKYFKCISSEKEYNVGLEFFCFLEMFMKL